MQPVEVADLVTDLQALAARFDPDAFEVADVPAVLLDLGRAQRLVAGMATLLTRRAAEATADQGPAAAAEMVATAAGVSQGEARRKLATSRRLAEQPDVADAVRQGTLSDPQAEAIADAVAANPGAAAGLLDAAGVQSVPDLRRTCRDRRAAADPDLEARRARHHRQRSFRSWFEQDGEWRASMSAPGDIGARIEAALRGAHDAAFRAAHAEGRREPDAAYRLDGLVDLVERGAAGACATASVPASTTPDDAPDVAASDVAPAAVVGVAPLRSARQAKVIALVDLAALMRGYVEGDETCEIAGVGRVPLSTIKAMIPGAHLSYVIRDAVDVRSVAHLGRQATAHQRTALEARGWECAVPTCRSTHLLEIDHVRDWAFSRQTLLEDLDLLCPRDHDLKTNHGHQLKGPPGRRTWHAPDGTLIAAPPPAHERPTRGGPADLLLPDGRTITLLGRPDRPPDRRDIRRHRCIRRQGWTRERRRRDDIHSPGP